MMRARPLLLGTFGLLAIPLVWESLVVRGTLDPVFASSPSRVVAALPRVWTSGELPRDLLATASALALGLTLATCAGVALGLVMGLHLHLEEALGPMVWFLYSAPVVAFYPLIVLWVGLGLPAVVAIVAVLSATPVAVNTVLGVRSADAALVRAVRSFGANACQVARLVLLPAALPLVVGGLRIGAGRALIGVVMGEMFSANVGLGYRLTFYGARLRTTEVLVEVMALVCFGVAITQLLRLLEARAGRWRDNR